MSVRKGFGLVLAGGGGKGAYEIGVWKALLECSKIEIGAVSGTSVGALNAALFAAGDYKKAENIWRNISSSDILTQNQLKIKGYSSLFVKELSKAASKKNYTIKNVKLLLEISMGLLLYRYLHKKLGMFSREGLEAIIEKSNIADTLNSKKIPCYATCFNISEFRTQYFQLNDLNPNTIVSVLLASSAIPIVFPMQEIKGTKYYDGGIPMIGDNVPVKPLYEAGWRKFIVVHLDRDSANSFKEKFKNSQFIHIYPKRHQGGLFDGTLDFSPKSSQKRIESGYRDMMEQIELINNIDQYLNETEKSMSEIHIHCGKYYNSMKEVFKDCNEDVEKWNSTNSIFEIDDNELQFTDMEKNLEEICNELCENKKEMNEFVLKGVSAISASDSLSNEMNRDKNIFEKLLSIFGDKKLQGGINSSLIDSQKKVMKMICKLVQSDKISTELIGVVQNQLQAASLNMLKILKAHGVEISNLSNNIENISRKYFELEGKNIGLEKEIEELYSAISKSIKSSKKRFDNIENRIQNLEFNQRLQAWCSTIKFLKFSDIEYTNLNTYEKLICVVSDFFWITKGKWDNASLLFIKVALDNLDINSDELVSFTEMIFYMTQNDMLRSYLFDRNGILYHLNKYDNDLLVLNEVFFQGIYMCKKITANESNLGTAESINNYLVNNGVDCELKISAFQMVCELLVGMIKNQVILKKYDDLIPYNEIRKKALLGDLPFKEKYINILFKHNYVKEAYEEIENLDEYGYESASYRELKDKVLFEYVNKNLLE